MKRLVLFLIIGYLAERRTLQTSVDDNLVDCVTNLSRKLGNMKT